MKLLMENWRRFLTEEEENTSPEERPPAGQQGKSWETWTIAELEDLINTARTGEHEAATKALASQAGQEIAQAIPGIGSVIGAGRFLNYMYKKVNYQYKGTGGRQETESDDNPADYPILDALHVDPELLATLDQEILNDIDEKYQEYLQSLSGDTLLGKVTNINDFLHQYVANLTKNHVVITDQSGEN
tara:strand:- start:147 stop:710 length:564 start_codon:yes stop_codon:yes gene_type:complete